MKVEKYTTVKDQTTGFKIRTIQKRKRTSLREQNDKTRTQSLEGIEKMPNITENEIKHFFKSKRLEFDIEEAQENAQKIKTGLGSCLDDIDAIIKRCQAIRNKSK